MSTTQNPQEPQKGGIVSAIAMLFGAFLILFSLLSVLNTALGWNIEVNNTPLPQHWDATLGLIGVTVVFWAIWAFMTYVGPVRRFGQKHPWIMALFVVIGLVGLIVGITIWDNGNIKARHEAAAAKAQADSLDRIKDSATFFEGRDVPYRLAVFNPVASKVAVLVDGEPAGEIAPYEAMELQLPWRATTVALQNEGKELSSIALKPDSTAGKDPARLQVYCPLKKLDIWIYDYSVAYRDGKLSLDSEYELPFGDFYHYDELNTVDKAGPLYVYPNQAAPASTPYHVYRFVILPDEIEEPQDRSPFAAWIMRRVDKRAAPAPAESPSELYRLWQAEQ